MIEPLCRLLKLMNIFHQILGPFWHTNSFEIRYLRAHLPSCVLNSPVCSCQIRIRYPRIRSLLKFSYHEVFSSWGILGILKLVWRSWMVSSRKNYWWHNLPWSYVDCCHLLLGLECYQCDYQYQKYVRLHRSYLLSKRSYLILLADNGGDQEVICRIAGSCFYCCRSFLYFEVSDWFVIKGHIKKNQESDLMSRQFPLVK